MGGGVRAGPYLATGGAGYLSFGPRAVLPWPDRPPLIGRMVRRDGPDPSQSPPSQFFSGESGTRRCRREGSIHAVEGETLELHRDVTGRGPWCVVGCVRAIGPFVPRGLFPGARRSGKERRYLIGEKKSGQSRVENSISVPISAIDQCKSEIWIFESEKSKSDRKFDSDSDLLLCFSAKGGTRPKASWLKMNSGARAMDGRHPST